MPIKLFFFFLQKCSLAKTFNLMFGNKQVYNTVMHSLLAEQLSNERSAV